MTNFKIVTNLDLSGNEIIDVRKIARSDYSISSPQLDLEIYAGSDAAGDSDVPGGALKFYSGVKGGALANGNLEFHHPLHSLIFSDDSLAITVADKPINVTTGSGAINVDSGLITVTNDLWIKGNTTLGDGIGNDVTVLGSDFMVAASIDLAQPANPENLVFTVENETGNTEIMGTFLQGTVGLGDEVIVYNIEVDGVSKFKVLGSGTTHIQGALYVYSTPIIFSGAEDFQVGADDATTRETILYMDTTIGSNDFARTLTIDGSTTFSNITANDFTNLLTDKTTVNLFNTVATTVEAFASATVVNIGVAGGVDAGLTTINHDFQVLGQTDYLKFDTGYTESGLPEGSLFWSTGDHALSYRPEDADVTINIGQEQVIRVRNNTASTILNGKAVYIVKGEATGLTPHIAPARANALETSCVCGVTTNEIAAGSFGYVSSQGIVRSLDTSGFSIGTPLFLSAAMAGEFTAIAPTEDGFPEASNVVMGLTLNSLIDGAVRVQPGIGWTTFSSLAKVYIDTLRIRDQFILSSDVQTDEASIYWDDTDKLIKYNTGAVVRTIVDTESTQDIINKSYNTLDLTANANGFTIAGGSTSRSFIMEDNVTLHKALVLNDGDLTINADVLNSVLSLPEGSLDFSELDTTDVNQKALTLENGVIKVNEGIATDSEGNMTIDGWLIVNGTYRTTSVTQDFLPDIVTTTLNIAQLTPDINIGNLGAVANVIEIGNSNIASVINLNSTKESTAYTNGAVVIDGGLGVAKNIYANGKLYLTGNGPSDTLNLGGDVDLYRSLADELTIADNVILMDLQSSNTTFNFATETVTTLNTLSLTNTTLNIGTTGANTRQTNLYSTVQVGEEANQKDINLYGSLNIGGALGYGIQYDDVDDSINFVKLV